MCAAYWLPCCTEYPSINARPKRGYAQRRGKLSVAPGVTHFLRGCHHALDDRGNSPHPLDSRVFRSARRWGADPSVARDRSNRDHLPSHHRAAGRLGTPLFETKVLLSLV